MTKHDTKEMIQRCIEEIEGLRRRLAIAEPKAEAYDTLRQVLGLLPRANQGFGEDMVWRLKLQLKELDKVEPTEAHAHSDKN